MLATPGADLLIPLFEGAYEEPLFGGFLDRLRLATGAACATLFFRPPGTALSRLVFLFSGERAPPEVDRMHRESLFWRDPLPYRQMREGELYALADWLELGTPEHVAFYRRLLVLSRLDEQLNMRVREPGGMDAWLSISARAGAFGAETQALMQSLAPYLRAALRGFVALTRERFNSSVAGDAIRRLNFGWLTLDAEGCVIDADAEAARLLEHADIIRRNPQGRLAVRNKEVDRELAAALQALSRGARSRPRALVLSRDPWLDMLLVPAPKQQVLSSPAPAMIAYVHGDGWSAADRCEQLAELFELMPSEARLALALSRGMTITEAATELGLTIETARTYSKKLYAKTGARGQSDVVRFVLTSVLAMA